MQQRSEDWFTARLGKATASRFGDIMAKTKTGYSASRKNYKAQLVIERLTGLPTETYTNGAMQWGIDTEPLARVAYELTTGNDVEQTGFIELKNIKAGASPDGFVGEDGIVEIKCPNSATHIEYLKSTELPREYKAQVQGQLWITDRQWADFISYDPRMPENLRLKVTRVERDDEYIKELATEVGDFLSEVEEELEDLKTV